MGFRNGMVKEGRERKKGGGNGEQIGNGEEGYRRNEQLIGIDFSILLL